MALTHYGMGLSFLKSKQFELRNWLNHTQIYQRHGHILATAGGEGLCTIKCSKNVWMWHSGTRFSDNVMMMSKQLALEVFSNLSNSILLWFYVVESFLHQHFPCCGTQEWEQRLSGAPNFIIILSYHLCPFVTSQEVKGAGTAAMFLAIDQIYRLQFDASFEQFRLSVFGSD